MVHGAKALVGSGLLLLSVAVADARASRGSIRATIDGRHVSGKYTYHRPDIDALKESVVACLVGAKDVGCLQEIDIELTDPSVRTTGEVPCTSLRYRERDAIGNEREWDASSCSVTIRKPRVKRPHGVPILWRFHGRFEAIVAPETGQGGPDLRIRGRFVSVIFCPSGGE
ncbi:MAG: hypothetical protein ACREQL_15760 [Candidatus Binatia bacterium]